MDYEVIIKFTNGLGSNFEVCGGWLGLDVAARTTSAPVICKGKSVFWPLVGLPFAKRSTAISRPRQRPRRLRIDRIEIWNLILKIKR
jgi:hypothetical protein